MRFITAILLFAAPASALAQEPAIDPQVAAALRTYRQIVKEDERALYIIAMAEYGPKLAPAIPELLTALQSKHEGLGVGAAYALSRIGKPSVEPVAKLLDSPEARTRLYAIWTLGLIGVDARDTFPTILPMLGDKDAKVRRKAAYALGRIPGDRDRTIQALALALCEKDEDVRQDAGESLAKFGAAAVPTLINSLKHGNVEVRLVSASTLESIGPDAGEAAPILRERFLADDSENPERYAQVLSKLGTPGLTELTKGFKGPRFEVRWIAAKSIRSFRGQAVPFLLECLADKDADTRILAASMLASMQIMDRSIVLALAAGLSDPDDGVRLQCMYALNSFGAGAQPALDRLRLALRDLHPDVRGIASAVLPRIGEGVDNLLEKDLSCKDARIRMVSAALKMQRNVNDKNAVPVLKAGLDEPDDGLRVVAAYGLAWRSLEVERLLPIFVAGLKHPTSAIRLQAATGLGMVAESRPGFDVALADALGDPDPAVAQAAMNALRIVARDPKKMQAIMKRRFDEGNARVRAMVVNAAQLYGGLTLELVAAGLKDPDENVRWTTLAVAADKFPSPSVLPLVAPLVKDQSVKVRSHLWQHFQNAREGGAPHLGILLRDSNAGIRVSACNALKVIGAAGKEALPALHQAMKDEKSMVREAALEALVSVSGEKAAAPFVKAALSDDFPAVRVTALILLRKTMNEDEIAALVPQLIECLTNDNASVRHFAAFELQVVGVRAAPALPLLRKMAESDPDPTVRNVADNSVRFLEGALKMR